MAKRMTRRDFLKAALAAAGGLTLLDVINEVTKAQAWQLKRYMPLVSRGVDPSLTPTPTSTSTPTPSPTVTQTPTPTATRTNTSTPTSTATASSTPTATATTTTPSIPGLPPLPAQSIVTHVRHETVTTWGGGNSGTAYWDNSVVHLDRVNAMMEAGLKNLTGQSTESASWDVLFRRISANGYQSGQKIAIKVNFNNATEGGGSCTSHSTTKVDALPQMILSLVESLHRVGVPYDAIYIYDATTSGIGDSMHGKPMYQYFRAQFSGKAVHFVGTGNGNCSGEVAQCTYGSHSSLTVNFASAHQSKGLLARQLTDTLYQASYLINVPILKSHGQAFNDTAFTGAFKNHLGSINYVLGNSNDRLHDFIMVGGSGYSATVENPMVTLYKNPHIGGKTILTLCDALYGGGWSQEPMNIWDFCGGKPANSLLFSIDPVAMDCIIADMIRSESRSSYSTDTGNEHPYDFLHHAASAGLGRFESRHPYDGSDKYTTIVYNRINLT